MNGLFERLAFYSMLQIIGFGLIVGGVYYITFYNDGSSMQTQMMALSQQIQVQEVKKKETEATLREEADMKASVGQLSVQYAEITKRLPSTLASLDMTKSIDTFARSAGVTVKSKRPGEVVRKEIIDEVPIEVTLEGTYAEIAQFTYYVSISERLSRVRNLRISSQDNVKTKKLLFEGQVVGYKIGTGDKKE